MSQVKLARGYCRVSTLDQVEEGVSLATQSKRITDYCAFMGFTLVKVYEDGGISGKDITNRPGFKQWIADSEKGDYLIVCDLTRFSRDTIDALNTLKHLNTKGVYLISIDNNLDFSSSMGKMIFTILCAFGEMNRETITANISVNMQRLSKEGKLRTRPPFGWKFIGKDQDLEEVPSQQDCIRRVIELFTSGTKVAQITKILNDDGLARCLLDNKRTITPGQIPRFHDQTVKRILVDHGYINSNKVKVPLESRIVSQHKISETSSSEIQLTESLQELSLN